MKIAIELTCCGVPMKACGHLSLRGPAECTRLGYECPKCGQRAMVVDQWYEHAPTQEVLRATDDTP